MKKVFIMTHSMDIGGAERSLIEMLNCFDYENYDVDLFLCRHQGEWMNEINPNVHLLPEIKEYSCLAVPINELIKKGQIGILAGRITGKIKAHAFNKKHSFSESSAALEYSHKYTKGFMPKINPDVKYDLAISFLTPHYLVAEKVNAKKKIAWIHTDYSTVEVDVDSELKMWGQYDYIASVSDNCTNSFCQKFPSLKNKIICIENVLSHKTTSDKALDSIAENIKESDSLSFLSIGRFAYPKNFDNIPSILKKIRENGFNVKWYIIGYGNDESLIKEKISEAGMDDYVILLGKKDNPYPYIKACDIYVQPSRYEGKSVTVREAQMLGKPVIITDYPTAGSQLKNGYDGIVVPLDNDGCARGICDALSNPEILSTIAENTKKEDYTNKSELDKLYNLIP